MRLIAGKVIPAAFWQGPSASTEILLRALLLRVGLAVKGQQEISVYGIIYKYLFK